ncbi:MAG: hypothetical protein GKR89_30350 [Candidatus Latescibacteria bacterium]|nr:hypothetical protein [Candidatus Latescibacterota bacterium]
MPQPRTMFYHDGRHPLIYMYEPPIQQEEYEAGVDELVGTPVDALMFCLGDGRTVLHDTQVGEVWGDNVEQWPHLVFQRAHRNARHLIDNGLDPLQIIAARARAKNLLFYPTLLVQQGRGPRSEDVRCSEFRFNNPHLEIGAQGDVAPDFPGFYGLDFKHPEVRQERFALIEETLGKYDVDGFELQLNYTPYYFHPDQVEAGCDIMTAWIEQVHQAVKASGPDRELVIRIPASLQGCRSIGLAVATWIRHGLVDCLVGQTFSGPELINPQVDFRPLVEAAQGSSTRIHAALQSHLDSDRLREAPIAMMRAAACNYWAQGVDGLYLAHWFNNWPYKASFYEKLRELPHPDIMAAKDKTYHVPTATGRYPVPTLEPGEEMILPAPLAVGQEVAVPFTISDDLPTWNNVGRIHQVLLRLRIMGTTELDRLHFALNGQELPATTLRRINEMYRMAAPRYRTGSGYWFIWRLDASHWPQQGANTLSVTLLERDPGVLPEVTLRDVELEIQYLMGQNFHRDFVDPDLGLYEHATA